MHKSKKRLLSYLLILSLLLSFGSSLITVINAEEAESVEDANKEVEEPLVEEVVEETSAKEKSVMENELVAEEESLTEEDPITEEESVTEEVPLVNEDLINPDQDTDIDINIDTDADEKDLIDNPEVDSTEDTDEIIDEKIGGNTSQTSIEEIQTIKEINYNLLIASSDELIVDIPENEDPFINLNKTKEDPLSLKNQFVFTPMGNNGDDESSDPEPKDLTDLPLFDIENFKLTQAGVNITQIVEWEEVEEGEVIKKIPVIPDSANIIDPTKPLLLDFTYRVPVAGDDLPSDEVVHWGDKTTVEIAAGFDNLGEKNYEMLISFYQSSTQKSLGNVEFAYDEDGGKLLANVKFDGDKDLFEIPEGAQIAYANLRFRIQLNMVSRFDLEEVQNGISITKILGRDFPVEFTKTIDDVDITKKGELDPQNGEVTWTIEMTPSGDKTSFQAGKLEIYEDLTEVGYFDEGREDNLTITEIKSGKPEPGLEKNKDYRLNVKKPDLSTGDMKHSVTIEFLGENEYEKLVIKLLTKIDTTKLNKYDEITGTNQGLTNIVELRRTPDEGEVEKKTTSSTLNFTPHWIRKGVANAKVNEVNKEITWAIIVNPYGTKMWYPTVEEHLGKGLELVKIERYDHQGAFLDPDSSDPGQTLDKEIQNPNLDTTWGNEPTHVWDESNLQKVIEDDDTFPNRYTIKIGDWTQDDWEEVNGRFEPSQQFEDLNEPDKCLDHSVLLLVTTRFKPTLKGDESTDKDFYGENLNFLNRSGLNWWYPTIPFAPGGWDRIMYWHENKADINKDSLAKKGKIINEGDAEAERVRWDVVLQPMSQEDIIENFRIFDLLVHDDKSSWETLKEQGLTFGSISGKSQGDDITSVMGVNSDEALKVLNDLTPSFMMRYDAEILDENTGKNEVITSIKINSGGKHVADLLVVKVEDLIQNAPNEGKDSGALPQKVYPYSFQTKLHKNVYTDNHQKICNTASLYSQTKKLVNAEACVDPIADYFAKRLLSSTSSFDAYVASDEQSKEEALSELLKAESEKTSNGFNYSNKTAVFVIDIDVPGVKYVLETDEFKFVDQLPEGFTHEEHVILGRSIISDESDPPITEWQDITGKFNKSISTDRRELELSLKDDASGEAFNFDKLKVFVRVHMSDMAYITTIKNPEKSTYSNRAAVKSIPSPTEIEVGITSDSTLKIAKDYISKSSGKASGAFLPWSIDYINYGVELGTSIDSIKLIDNFSPYITLPNNSIEDAKIYLETLELQEDGKYGVNTDIAPIKYGTPLFNEVIKSVEQEIIDNKTASITFTIKPGTSSYRIHYSTEILPQIMESSEKIVITNKASLKVDGNLFDDSETSKMQSMAIVNAIGHVRKPFRINKVNLCNEPIEVTEDNFFLRANEVSDYIISYLGEIDDKSSDVEETYLIKNDQGNIILNPNRNWLNTRTEELRGLLLRGNYELIETKAPEGYLGLTGSWTINISLNPDFDPDRLEETVFRVEVKSNDISNFRWSFEENSGVLTIKNSKETSPTTTPPATTPTTEASGTTTTETTTEPTGPVLITTTTPGSSETTTPDSSEPTEPTNPDETSPSESTEPGETTTNTDTTIVPTVPTDTSETTTDGGGGVTTETKPTTQTPGPTTTAGQPITETGENAAPYIAIGTLFLVAGMVLIALRRRNWEQ